MRFNLTSRKLIASFAVVAALGGIGLNEGVRLPEAPQMDQAVATMQVSSLAQQQSKTVLIGIAKGVAKMEEDSARLHESARVGKYDRMIRYGSISLPVLKL